MRELAPVNIFDEKKAIALIEIGSLTETIKMFKTKAAEGEIERVEVINWIYKFGKLSPVIIGEIFIEWEKLLKNNYSEARKEQTRLLKVKKNPLEGIFPATEYTLPVRTMAEWFDKYNANYERFPFGYPYTRQCMQYRTEREEIITTDPDHLEDYEIGPRKENIVRKIKDEKIRNKIRLEIKINQYTAEKTKEIVEKIINRAEIIETAVEKKNEIAITVRLDGNSLILDFPNKEIRDKGNIYIYNILDKMKEFIAGID